jgi:hypothetical protein
MCIGIRAAPSRSSRRICVAILKALLRSSATMMPSCCRCWSRSWLGRCCGWSARMSWRAKLMLGWMSGASGWRDWRLHRVPVSDRRGVRLRMFQASDRILDLARWGFGVTTFDARPAGLVCVTSSHIPRYEAGGVPAPASSVTTDLATVSPPRVMRPGVYQFVMRGKLVQRLSRSAGLRRCCRQRRGGGCAAADLYRRAGVCVGAAGVACSVGNDRAPERIDPCQRRGRFGEQPHGCAGYLEVAGGCGDRCVVGPSDSDDSRPAVGWMVRQLILMIVACSEWRRSDLSRSSCLLPLAA